MAWKSYIAMYRKIGPVEIRLFGSSATVLSALGVKNYEFKLLPENYDNRYAMLKFSLKHYFTEIRESCNMGSRGPRGSLFTQIFKHFLFTPLPLQAADFKESVCLEMDRNQQRYSWENVDCFYEFKSAESVLDALRKPVLLSFIGFSEDLLLMKTP